MKDGLSRWMDGQGYKNIEQFRSNALTNMSDWKYLDLTSSPS
jgi:dihydropyrimidine dehydrogenase (NAD+) subunit PreA